ncbi:hypothetical protein [Bradyrhizobium sp. SZCCHNR1093]|uniref:hypothetical protein n=1 Tax=Bradyrhizobium sp. SZCCHNR1093 TaxID=3057368 RepID=UPI0028F0FD96|nr:hypothetical protein [Bradyrhizobium sp. SZCCHNR1093]
MNPKYLPTTLWGKLHRLSEEADEIVKAVGKAGRFGSLDGGPPDGGPNNAAEILLEVADIRHAISVVEGELQGLAAINVDSGHLIWTDTLIPTSELRQLIGDEEHETDEDFGAAHKWIPVCHGWWVREGLDWRFYVDQELD